jgi:hypothetical protein
VLEGWRRVEAKGEDWRRFEARREDELRRGKGYRLVEGGLERRCRGDGVRLGASSK